MNFLQQIQSPALLLALLVFALIVAILAFSRLDHDRRLIAKISQNEQNYRQTLERMQDGVFVARNGKVVLVNPRIVEWSGYASQFFVDKPIEELFAGEDRAAITQFFQSFNTDAGQAATLEARLFNRLDDVHWVQLQPIRSQWQMTPSLVIVLKDLTPIRQTQQSLKQSEDRYRFLVKNSPVGLVRLNRDLVVVDANQRVAELLHASMDDILGLDVHELGINVLVDTFQAGLAGQEKSCEEYLNIERFAFKGDMLVRAIPYREGEQITGVIGMLEDLTQWARTQKALQISEEVFARTFQLLPDAATLTQLKDGLYLQVNPGFCQLTGYRAEEVVGKTSLATGLWLNQEDRQNVMEEVARKGEVRTREVLLRRKDGTSFDATISTRLLYDTPEPIILSYFRDISEQKKSFIVTHKQLEQLAALRKIDQAITGSINLPFVLRILLDQVTTQLNLDAAAVMVYNTELDRCEYLAHEGFRTPPPKLYDVHQAAGYAAQAFYQRKLVLVPNLSANPDPFWQEPSQKDENFIFYAALPLRSKGEMYGVLETFMHRDLHPNEDWFEFLQALVDQAAIAVENALLFSRLQKQIVNLGAAFDTTLDGFARAVDLFLGQEEGYTRAIAHLSQDLALAMGMEGKELAYLNRGILLNNLAMIGAPTPERQVSANLSEKDWQVLWGRRKYLLDLLTGIDYLKPALAIPYNCMEWWNGQGHPRKLSGDSIPLQARVYAVVHSWVCSQSMLHNCNNERITLQAADARLQKMAGTQLDPQIVDIFLSMPDREPPRLFSYPDFSSAQ